MTGGESPDLRLDEAADLWRQLEAIGAEMATLAATIANELLLQPPRSSVRVTTARHRIAHLVRQYAPLGQRIAAAQAAAADGARDAGIPGGRLPPAWYDLTTRAHRFRNALNRWGLVLGLIDAQQPPRRRPLYRVADEIGDIVAAQAEATDAFLAGLHDILNPHEQGLSARARGAYPDIAMPHSRFTAHIHAAYRVLLASNAPGSDFLDVGCGGGMKVLAASALFDRATGIEFDPAYAASARQLLAAAGRGRCRVIELDAALFPDYAYYGVLFLYRPMQHDAAMRRLEETIVAQLRPGTILVAPYRGFAVRHERLGCARVDGGIYVAGIDAVAAAGLREAAEHIGAFFGRRPPDLPDVWEPILAASAARGFGIRGESWADTV